MFLFRRVPSEIHEISVQGEHFWFGSLEISFWTRSGLTVTHSCLSRDWSLSQLVCFCSSCCGSDVGSFQVQSNLVPLTVHSDAASTEEVLCYDLSSVNLKLYSLRNKLVKIQKKVSSAAMFASFIDMKEANNVDVYTDVVSWCLTFYLTVSDCSTYKVIIKGVQGVTLLFCPVDLLLKSCQ